MNIFNGKLRRHTSVIKNSILFDEEYYRFNAHVPHNEDAALHYLRNWRKGKTEPSRFFDTKFYLDMYKDVSASGYCPLLHYILYGWKEIRAPSPLFDRAGFLEQHPLIDASKSDPAGCCLMLYGSYDWKSGALSKVSGSAAKGVSQSIQVSPADKETENECRAYFDREFYLSMYRDVREANVDPFSHFMTFGYRENRDPAPVFDTHFYARKHLSDPLSENPLVHYVKRGMSPKFTTHSPNLVKLGIALGTTPATLTVCVHVHCYYPHLIGEVCKGLANLPTNSHVIITVCSQPDKKFVESYLRKVDLNLTSDVMVVPNRGRDIAPFIVGTAAIWRNYDLVLHLHTKSSRHISWGSDWRGYLFDQLMGTPQLIRSVIREFEADEKLGAFYPSNYFQIKNPIEASPNTDRVQSTLRFLGVKFSDAFSNEFPAGSMCWYRTKTLLRLIDKINDWALFDEETGQLDETLAHALERVFPIVVRSEGYSVRHYMTERRQAMGSPLPAPGRDIPSAHVTDAWPRDTPRAAARPALPLAPLAKAFNSSALDIHWVVPSFVKGAGGHMTIFRMVKFLEKFGHRQTIWLQNATNIPDPEVARQRIIDWFAPIGPNVHVLYLPEDVRQLSGDVVIATDCWTAFPVSRATKFKERFYFVQDFEPDFHPAGENRLVAESTYDFGFSALCAGAWLHQKMTERGLWARQWDLCADHSIYFPAMRKASGAEVQIAMYARPYTPRRAVQLGYAALELLAARGLRFKVHLFGEENLSVPYDFPCVQHGILDHEKLADLYRSVEIGMVFSATNYSLIPLEMAACGLPVIELDVPSTRAIFRNDEVAFAQPSPHGIADVLERLINDPSGRNSQSQRALDFVRGSSWEESARKIEKALVERLLGLGYKAVHHDKLATPSISQRPKVSVFIPAYNGGEEITRALQRVVTQECDFKFDVLVIDSESSDDTVERVKAFANKGVRLEQIEKKSFQHGRTRNLGISLTDGDYVAILTQDAEPKNPQWLSKLIGGFSRGDRVAGVTGRHEAYPAHGPFIANDMKQHFDNLALLPEVIDLTEGLPSFYYPGSVAWRMLANFYSDNNSAISREVWRQLPYPEIEWGEDYVWAAHILKAGFQKAYADEAVVFHSHDFSDEILLRTATTEGEFWAREFGIRLHDDEHATIAALNARDLKFATEMGISKSALGKRQKKNRLLIKGRIQGWRNCYQEG